MNITDVLSEISTPTGSIFIRFKERVGAVSANPQRGERSEATYLTAYAGFANAPEDLQQGNALRNFNSINSAEDIVNMIKAIFTDKVFLSVKSLTIYDDFTKPLQGDRSPIYKRHPFLLKFMKWVEREGGNQIKIADKVGQEGPPKIKRPRKENPNFGRKIRDVEQGETKKTVTFTVGPRFYKQAQRDLPNLMKYRGPNGTFVMPNDLFMQFRAQAEKTYPYAEIKLVNRVATGESFNEAEEKPKAVHCSQCGKGFSAGGLKAPHKTGFSHCKDHKGMKVVVSENLNEGQDKSPQDCGIVDGYYGRSPNPHKIEMGKRVKLTDPREIAAYMAGYKDDSAGSKVYEGIMKYALPIAGAALGGMYGSDLGTAGLDSYVDATNPDVNLGIASMKPSVAAKGGMIAGIDSPDVEKYSKAFNAIQKYGSPVGAALGAGAGMALSPSDRRRDSMTDEDDKRVSETVSGMGHGSAEEMLSHVEQAVESMQLALERELEWHLTDFYGTKVVAQLMHPAIVALENIKQFVAQQLAQAGQSEVDEDGASPAPPTPPPPAPTTSGTSLPSADPMVKNLPAINATGDGNNARTDKLASMVSGQSAKAAAPTTADKQMATTFETRILDIDDDDFWLMEAGKASRSFCKANARKRENMGASQLSSCISQGYLPHKSGKSVKVADRRIKLNGVKMKGEKYGGPKSTKAGE